MISILVVPGNIGKARVVEHRRQRKHEVQLAKGPGIPVWEVVRERAAILKHLKYSKYIEKLLDPGVWSRSWTSCEFDIHWKCIQVQRLRLTVELHTWQWLRESLTHLPSLPGSPLNKRYFVIFWRIQLCQLVYVSTLHSWQFGCTWQTLAFSSRGLGEIPLKQKP